MARLKKLQRSPKLRQAKSGNSPRSNPWSPGSEKKRGSSLLNCLACICLILNILVLSLSRIINQRLKDGELPPPNKAVSSPPTNSNTNFVAKSNSAAAATVPPQPALRGSTQDSVPAAPAATGGSGKNDYHIVFNTDCKDPTQDWQAYVFFFHIAKSRQAGDVTHIVTGCTEGGRRTSLEQTHQKIFEPLGRDPNGGPSRFRLHFAPAHPEQAGVGLLRTHMKYFNRPYGVQDWMEKTMGYSSAAPSNPNDNKVIVLMDTDMAILKPFGDTFVPAEEVWKKPVPGQSAYPSSVVPGKPVAQQQPFPPRWWEDINGMSFSTEIQAALNDLKIMSSLDLDSHYSAGPPFLVAAQDFYPLVKKWTELTFPLHQVLTEKVLREPHSPYALACAMLKKPHQLATTFSVSNFRDAGFELFVRDYKQGTGNAGGTGAQCRKFSQHMMPHVLQYSKRYALGNFIIGKHYVQQSFLGKPESCNAPLFAEPPENVAEIFNYYQDPELNSRVNIETDQLVHTMTFMVCETIQAFNDAASHYKRGNCGGAANMQKTLTFT